MNSTPEDMKPERITRLLDDVNRDTPGAADRLLAVIYDELHGLAAAHMRRERSDHTLQPTALVHEAFLRLLGEGEPHWNNRGHFFSAVALVMRRILVDYARRRLAERRGGRRTREPLDDVVEALCANPDEMLAIDDALTRLEAVDETKAKIVRLRFFAGLTNEEVAEQLGVSARTVKREWRFARAWLYRAIAADT